MRLLQLPLATVSRSDIGSRASVRRVNGTLREAKRSTIGRRLATSSGWLLHELLQVELWEMGDLSKVLTAQLILVTVSEGTPRLTR